MGGFLGSESSSVGGLKELEKVRKPPEGVEASQHLDLSHLGLTLDFRPPHNRINLHYYPPRSLWPFFTATVEN